MGDKQKRWSITLGPEQTQLLLLAALRHNCIVQPLAQLRRDLVQLLAPIDLDGLVRRIQDHPAMLALGGMAADLPAKIFAQLVVEIVTQLAQQVRAVHAVLPSFFCAKYLLRRSRNWSRARNSLDFTAGTLKPSASAV